MSPQRQFEGPDVRTLLDEICSTYGPEPTIAKAESFRTGGVLGFFQKEHYRLVVDGDPEQPADAEPKEKTLIYQAPPRLDGKASRGRHFAGTARSSTESRYGATDVDSPTGGYLALSAYSAVAATTSESDDPFASLAEDTEDAFVGATPWVEEPPQAPAPASAAHSDAGTDAPSFESVLRRVADFVDEPRVEPVTWPSAREWHPSTAEPDRAAAGMQPAAVTPPAVGVPPSPLAFSPAAPADAPATPAVAPAAPAVAEVGADLFSGATTPEPVADAPTTGILPQQDAPPVETGTDPAVEEFQVDAEEPRTGTEDFPTEPEPEVEEPLLLPRLSAEAASLRLALHRVGFDPEMVERIEDAAAQSDLEGALLEVFDCLEPAPRLPRRPGSLIVVVGSGRRAAAEARRIAGEVGSDPAGVAYATERRLPWPVSEELIVRSVEDAAELAPGHRRGRVGVVAVDVPVGSLGTSWAANVIHALRPSLVVGVVDAMYKNEDVSDWTERLGGVDSVVVDNLDCTVSPARVLSLEIPVDRIDDSPATATRWAATVLDRLAPGREEDDADDTRTVGLHFAGRRGAC